MKKMLSFALTLVLLLTAGVAYAQDWDLEGTVFPLEEPITFTVLTSGYRTASLSKITESLEWKSLCEATNVSFDFVFLGDYDNPEARTNLQNRLMNGDYGDAILCVYVNTLTEADILDLSTAGMLLPLTDYLYDATVMPNFYHAVTEVNPSLIQNMKFPDGDVYYLAGISEVAAYTSGEALMMVNSDWLKAWKESRGRDTSPATLTEFEDMLAYFADADLNGNGKKDEIPYFMAQNGYMGCATVEHAMGMYGIATKDSTADMDIMINDAGECFFAYTTDAYREALKTFSSWYQKNWIWEEVMTANAETITNTLSLGRENIGVYNINQALEGFEPLLPPAIDGYQARYHMHPSARKGVRQPYAVITDKCKNPEVLCSFLDLMYNFDNNIRFQYGEADMAAGGVVKNDAGKYVFTPKFVRTQDDANRALRDYIYTMEIDTLKNFEEKVDTDSYFGDSGVVKGYEMFTEAGIWNPTNNIWPRCTLLEEYSEDFAFMYTDVAGVVAEFRAKCLVGEMDVDTEWDNFQKKLQMLGIEEMREIVQKSYDAYLGK